MVAIAMEKRNNCFHHPYMCSIFQSIQGVRTFTCKKFPWPPSGSYIRKVMRLWLLHVQTMNDQMIHMNILSKYYYTFIQKISTLLTFNS